VGIRDQALWQDLKAITFLYSVRREQGNAQPEEVRYYIGSRLAQANAYASYVRSHWSIENSLHWVLDVCFDEDQCRKRTDNSPENMALLRRLALCLLKTHGRKGSIRGKRLQSGWNNGFLLEVLSSKD
jgi:predicted transposase YbfD/YdcC